MKPVRVQVRDLRPTDRVVLEDGVHDVLERLGIRAAARRGQPVRITLLRSDYSGGAPRKYLDLKGNVWLDVLRG